MRIRSLTRQKASKEPQVPHNVAHRDIKILTWIVSTLGSILIIILGWIGATFDLRLKSVEDLKPQVAEIRTDVKWLLKIETDKHAVGQVSSR
jgi:hypothetical protein